jgi:hypothetical protein
MQHAYIRAVPAGSREVTVAFNFISERTVFNFYVIFLKVILCSLNTKYDKWQRKLQVQQHHAVVDQGTYGV